MDAIPPEIRRIILRQMPDIASLSALVHASPNYHASYLGNREAVFTIVTLRSLQSQGVKILPACSAAKVYLREGQWARKGELKMAFQCLYRQIEKSVSPELLTDPVFKCWRGWEINSQYTSTGRYEPPSPVTGNESIKLSIEHCLVLLKVRHMVPLWRKGSGIYHCWSHDIKSQSWDSKPCDLIFEPLSTKFGLEAIWRAVIVRLSKND